MSYLGTKSSFKVSPDVTVPTGTSSTNSYSSTGLKPSTKYYYKIAAVDNAGNIGRLSSQVSKTTAASTSSSDKTPPAQVTGLIVSTVSSTQLNLAWTEVSASDFNHYNI
jgi:chitinase